MAAVQIHLPGGAQLRSASCMSPDRSRGGRLTGPPAAVGGAQPWPGQQASYEPSGPGGMVRHLSPPPLAQHAMSQAAQAQQAYVHLGQDQAPTARPQWREMGVRQGVASPLPQRHSTQSLHAPSTQQSARPVQLVGSPMAPAGRVGPMLPLPVKLEDSSQGGSHMVPIPGRTPSMDDGATARFSVPATPPPWALQHSQHASKMNRSEHEQHSARRRAGSIGGCSAVSSVPGHSPKTAPRETKHGGIEMPVTVVTQRPLVIDHQVADSMSQKMDEVAGKVGSIETLLRATARDQIEALQQELEQANLARRIAEEAAVAQARAHSEVEERLRRSEQLLQEEAAIREQHEQQLSALEESRQAAEVEAAAMCQAADMARQREGQAEAARAAVSESTNLAAHWESECHKKDIRIADLERNMKTVYDQCNTYKVRHSSLENQIDHQRLENDKLREQFDLLSLENSQVRERLEMENAALAHDNAALARDKQSLEARLGDANGRLQASEVEHHALREETLQQERASASRGADARAAIAAEAAAQREREFAAQLTAQLEARERAVAAKEQEVASVRHRAAELERAGGELEQKRADFQQQSQEMEQQFERHREELERQVKEQRQKHSKHGDYEKENRALKQTTQDQKTELFNLESQLHREQVASSYMTPGEFVRMAKKHEGELFAHDNSALKLRNSSLQTEVGMVRWHNELMRKHLPRSEWEAVAKEMQAQTGPPKVDAHGHAM